MKLKVCLRSARILDDRAPAFAPLRFHEADRGWRAPDNRMVLDVQVRPDAAEDAQHTRLPGEGHYRPASLYSIRLDATVFEGSVDDRLTVRVDARPPDTGGDEIVSTYEREFTGDPASWVGEHRPHGAAGPEHLGFWQLFYRIDPIGD